MRNLMSLTLAMFLCVVGCSSEEAARKEQGARSEEAARKEQGARMAKIAEESLMRVNAEDWKKLEEEIETFTKKLQGLPSANGWIDIEQISEKQQNEIREEHSRISHKHSVLSNTISQRDETRNERVKKKLVIARDFLPDTLLPDYLQEHRRYLKNLNK